MGKTCPNKNWRNPAREKTLTCKSGAFGWSADSCDSGYLKGTKVACDGAWMYETFCAHRSWGELNSRYKVGSGSTDAKKCCGIMGNEPSLDSDSVAKIGNKLCGKNMCNGGEQCDALIQEYCDGELEKKTAGQAHDSDKCECYIQSKLLTDEKLEELTGAAAVSGSRSCYIESCTNDAQYPDQLFLSDQYDSLQNCPDITICSIKDVDITGAGEVNVDNHCGTSSYMENNNTHTSTSNTTQNFQGGSQTGMQIAGIILVTFLLIVVFFCFLMILKRKKRRSH